MGLLDRRCRPSCDKAHFKTGFVAQDAGFSDHQRWISVSKGHEIPVTGDVVGDHLCGCRLGAFCQFVVTHQWHRVHTAVHKGLGLAGAVTNGVMRDLGDLEPGFPVLAGSIGPSHAFVHVREIACTVSIFGMQVHDEDLVHADRHGALVIPRQVIPELHSAIEKLLTTEQLILGPARAEGFTIDKLKDAWAAFEQART